VGVLLVYWRTNQYADAVVMPLDDTYIHFQYARQIAEGAPYTYNPTDTPTSGATSFIYPYLLAAGYTLGFEGLRLGLWAMAIGAVLLFISMATFIGIARQLHLPGWMGTGAALLYGLSGAITWHSMSGMETAVMMTATLLTFYALLSKRLGWFAIAASLLAMTRPEGSLMAGIAAVILFLQHRSWSARLLIVTPIIAAGIQPLVNLLITGELSASGNQAKSILGMVPFEWGVVIERIGENWLRMWREFLFDTRYTAALLVPLALVGWWWLMRYRWRVGVIVFGWMITVTAAIATLDTAFWHFKRYQMPLIALFYPLAMIGLWHLFRLRGISYQRSLRYALAAIISVLVVFSAGNTGEFHRLYRVNVENVMAQPLLMAQWLAANTPPDALVAVHDVGMMRYIGERNTVDMVGLTTPQAADYWRHGPGAVAEFLLNIAPPVDYVAAYTTARGLNYLVDTPLYGTLEAGFTAIYDPADNVALGADFQGIYRADWNALTRIDQHSPQQPSAIQQAEMRVSAVNVGDLQSEAAVHYTWDGALPGFVTEVYDFAYVDCITPACTVTDGGRRFDGSETFTINVTPGQDHVLITRLHPGARGSFDVYANDTYIATRWIPEYPGRWLEVATPIPAQNNATLNIRIEPHGVYIPYYHWLYTSVPSTIADTPLIATFQDGAFGVQATDLTVIDQAVTLGVTWQVNDQTAGDYKLFVHIYADTQAAPSRQLDTYAGNDTLPVGNWRIGMFSDEIMVDLEGLAPGNYTVAMGLYDPVTFERLSPQSDVLTVDADRLFIGEFSLNDG